jgi:CBS domain-containing protein
VRNDETVRTAVARMVKHNLKRLPVVNEEGRLMGMVSRIDVFRSVQLHYDRQTAEVEEPKPGRSVTELMYTDAPTVGPNATLEEIVRALEASRRRRVIVVDDERRVLGIITDGDLLRRSQQRQHPGLLERLRRLVVGEPAVAQVLPSAGERAADLMSTPVITIHPDAPLGEALRLMTTHAVKRLPVVDEEGRLLGLLGRASVLRGLMEANASA